MRHNILRLKNKIFKDNAKRQASLMDMLKQNRKILSEINNYIRVNKYPNEAISKLNEVLEVFRYPVKMPDCNTCHWLDGIKCISKDQVFGCDWVPNDK
jgi:hypothetical protein